jgi:hypothetical protein
MKHATHTIRNNSRASYAEFDADSRAGKVMHTLYNAECSMTDREIRDELGFQEMNQVRPTITHLLDSGHLVEAGQTICSTTNRVVRLVSLCHGPPVPRVTQSTQDIISDLRADVCDLKREVERLTMMLAEAQAQLEEIQ